ncbi:FadR family transcriptional regulator [Paramagnetospirillum kuznetsovii]|uniref:FadR family transcriptional regulator n=1 Tax=Paramagnetospirillum kuznetsovii TaxID=2053833 RepID=A0A364NWK1_9PROT|nr:FadR/GntR family transcriptional regulator [Paramagnetospirillum kuznetsovii]RAU21297.1 FadR family transcriptional regulator [Paramagnetospirillum kuznetsovii]
MKDASKLGNRPSGLVSERVADRILARIASGEWGPGHRLPGERHLAEDMGVSRVSVRAALQSLKTQGLLDAVQGGGTRVIATTAAMDPGMLELVRVNGENLTDLAEIRSILEVWAAGRAARRRTEADIAALDAIMTATKADIDAGKHKSENDIRFHLAIAKASSSGIYMHFVAMIRGMLSEMVDYHRYELFPTRDDDHRILSQHQAIFDGIRTGDADAAQSAMKEHLGWVLERYAKQHNNKKS